MSKKKTILAKIKNIFTEETLDEVKLFVDVKTEDGKILRVSDMSVGSTVTEITEDGEKEVESGSFELVGGVTMIVEDGKISEINKVDENTEDEMTDDEEKLEEVVEEIVKEEDELDEHEGLYLKLEDGTEIHVVTKVEGELSEGDVVHIVSEEKEMSPAPEGEHTLDDGRIIVLDGESKLVEVRETLSEEKEEEEMSEEVLTEEVEAEEAVKVTNQLKDLISQIKDLKNSFEDMKKENDELKSRFNKFASEPSEQPIKEKISFSNITREDKLKFFSKR